MSSSIGLIDSCSRLQESQDKYTGLIGICRAKGYELEKIFGAKVMPAAYFQAALYRAYRTEPGVARAVMHLPIRSDEVLWSKEEDAHPWGFEQDIIGCCPQLIAYPHNVHGRRTQYFSAPGVYKLGPEAPVDHNYYFIMEVNDQHNIVAFWSHLPMDFIRNGGFVDIAENLITVDEMQIRMGGTPQISANASVAHVYLWRATYPEAGALTESLQCAQDMADPAGVITVDYKDSKYKVDLLERFRVPESKPLNLKRKLDIK